MMDLNLYQQYLNGNQSKVWKAISFLEYGNLDKAEKDIVVKIIEEVISRIDHNFIIALKIMEENGFYYNNFGDINSLNQPYLVRGQEEYNQLTRDFVENSLKLKLPLFFSFFSAFFKVIDFRGLFEKFEPKILLDALFIESPNNLNDIEDRNFEQVYNEESVVGHLFSPDAFIKEGASGDLGPCILLSEKTLIDNSVINYSDDISMTFVEYLRFCFHWSCFPNLFWASEEEREPFLPMLKKVRENIRQF